MLVDLSCRFRAQSFLFNSVVAWAVCFVSCPAGVAQQKETAGPRNLHELISCLEIREPYSFHEFRAALTNIELP